jgi:hypothetical protein
MPVAARWQRSKTGGGSPTGQPQAATAENRSGPFWYDIFFLFLFLFFLSSKGGFPQKRGRAKLIRNA